MMLSKAGVFAHSQAEVVAHRIADEIHGTVAGTVFDGNGYCMLESGGGKAGFAFGDFFGEPAPQIQLRQVGRRWHLGKVLLEKWWLTPPGLRREVLRLGLRLGSKVSGINVGL
jgi:sulfide:quinone oxidoreductase